MADRWTGIDHGHRSHRSIILEIDSNALSNLPYPPLVQDRILTRWPFRSRDPPKSTSSLPIRTKEPSSQTPQEPIYAIIDYDDAYVQPIILTAVQALIPASRLILLAPNTADTTTLPPTAKVLHIRAYEALPFADAMARPAGTTLLNSYVIRKALIRKHFLSATVDHWAAKHPDARLGAHVKRGEAFEVDYAEFLDDALVEAFDLRASLARNELVGGQQHDQREWWILKPSMSDRGQGIRLFSSMEQLQGIFDGWEVESESDEDEDEDDRDGGDVDVVGKEKRKKLLDDAHITASDLRFFVAQPYIDPPLLLPSCNNRKFHIRTYVLCVGAMRVYVCREMLALFAARPYAPPSAIGQQHQQQQDAQQQQEYLDAHLTNTCLQGPRADAASVQPFWDLRDDDDEGGVVFDAGRKEDVFAQICAVTGEVFEAAAREMMVHFQPVPWAFEVYGLDFLVDAGGRAWLLEVNAFPDFKQTGEGLRERVVEGFWKGVVRLAVGPWAGVETEDDGGMVLVREIDLGRR